MDPQGVSRNLSLMSILTVAGVDLRPEQVPPVEFLNRLAKLRKQRTHDLLQLQRHPERVHVVSRDPAQQPEPLPREEHTPDVLPEQRLFGYADHEEWARCESALILEVLDESIVDDQLPVLGGVEHHHRVVDGATT